MLFMRRPQATPVTTRPDTAGTGSQEEPTDETLVLRIESGDRSALALLFDRYSTLIFSIGLRILREEGEAEDFVQDVFIKLFEKVKGFDPDKGSGRSWIIQIAYRRAFDRYSYLSRRSFYDGTDLEEVENTLRGSSEVEAQLVDSLTGDELHAAFGELGESQRRTLEMFFFEGLEFREIAERLGETFEQTRHFYYRGLERLRRNAIGHVRRNRK